MATADESAKAGQDLLKRLDDVQLDSELSYDFIGRAVMAHVLEHQKEKAAADDGHGDIVGVVRVRVKQDAAKEGMRPVYCCVCTDCDDICGIIICRGGCC